MDSEGSLGGIQSLGIVNAIRTGNILVDMVIAMCIPMVFGYIANAIGKILEVVKRIDWIDLIGRKHIIYKRSIRHSTITDSYGCTTDLGGDTKNELLIKAVQLYLDNHGLLELNNADLELKSFWETKRNNYYDYYGTSDLTTLSDTLSKYNVVKKPLKNRWVSLGMIKSPNENKEYEVKLLVQEEKADEKEGTSKNHRCELTLWFQSEGKESIDNFINKTYCWYLDELRKLEDDSRYMYELVTPKKVCDAENSATQKYKRYQLSDEKTFESLFFQQKENIVGTVDHFVEKTGKYAVKGYPHKLGMLLHGPPGTGKTSLIKVLAQRTGRSIVNVPLARISTNAELASIFFDQKYSVEGEDVPITLGFKDVIFVMEDIDAVSKIVKRRDGKTTTQMADINQLEGVEKKSLWTMILESTNESCKTLAKELIEKSERLKTAAHDPQILSMTAQRAARVPGISIIGDCARNNTTRSIAKEASSSVDALMNGYEKVDSFLGKHAKSLKQMLDSGCEINEAFENELLNVYSDGVYPQGSLFSLCSSDLSTEDSFDQISEDDCNAQVKMYIESMEKSENDSEDVSKSGFIGPKVEVGSSSNLAYRNKRDELNLTGILNVLDGVVDTPGRMLIITTNHPEVLDPALIRPGRIDKKILLGYMVDKDVVLMMEHYFQIKLDTDQVKRINKAMNDKGLLTGSSLKLSPAEVEQMASEFEDVENMIVTIENKASLNHT